LGVTLKEVTVGTLLEVTGAMLALATAANTDSARAVVMMAVKVLVSFMVCLLL
jgi:hypothetical protein